MKIFVLLCVLAFGFFMFKNLFPYLNNMHRLEEFLYEKNAEDKKDIEELISKFDIKGLKIFISAIIVLIVFVTLVVFIAALRGAFTY